ncbi:MAG TPA: ammonium transporter [Zoogloea sp.]|uniref:ammonium transporter n=1 Tax=Zoogloea sp. TaxID=49181 RepID=UPI002D11E24C|nr:ammonium transporter [Zoogloea sp.]HOB46931.1 ammonium transporter [Zoogloea sp.]HQA10527.1 ammonium transporter [Zoogloea sp.]HQE39389.1 ammonium transporter [Zoogloea sp.]
MPPIRPLPSVSGLLRRAAFWSLFAAPAGCLADAVPAPRLDGANTAWMLVATTLVLLMTLPGVALFYGGMVRRRNVLATMSQSVAIAAVVSLVWCAVGYSLAMRPGGAFIGGLDRLFLGGLSLDALAGKAGANVPESVFAMFQLAFAIITTALVPGAFAERMKFSALLLFAALWSLLVYAPVAHWVWEPGGWLARRGVLDYAGGTVVHINAGVAGLVCAMFIGPRAGFGRQAMTPYNLALTLAGAALLWVGWMGFNAGSALAADSRAGMAMLVTQLAAAAAAVSWMAAEWLMRGRPGALGLVSGAVAGLVAVTPASGFVTPAAALLIGGVAGIGCYLGATLLKRMTGWDDALDAFGIHGVGGIVGALLTGVLAAPEVGGVRGDFLVQLAGVAATVAYSGAMSFVVLVAVDGLVGLRVSGATETEGLDIVEHGEAVA